jgi:hypothetical protein
MLEYCIYMYSCIIDIIQLKFGIRLISVREADLAAQALSMMEFVYFDILVSSPEAFSFQLFDIYCIPLYISLLRHSHFNYSIFIVFLPILS